MNQNPGQNSPIKNKIKEYENHYRQLAWEWMFTMRGLIIISALLSASSAIIGKLEVLEKQKLLGLSRSDIAAILAASATVVSTIQGAVKFDDNSNANRMARDGMKVLELELLKNTSEANEVEVEVISKMQKVIQHRLSMTGIDVSELEEILSIDGESKVTKEQNNKSNDSNQNKSETNMSETATNNEETES